MTTAMLAVPMIAAAASPPVVVYSNPVDAAKYAPGIGWNPVVDYTKPQFAQSPNIRKFIDTLPGVGFANRNNLGQYIPLATPDTTTFAGDATGTSANPASDYYEIELKDYNMQMHTDLPATALRGYAQVNSADSTVNNVHQYLGPLILAKTYDPTKPTNAPGNGKPVRIKFFNRLGTGAAGKLNLPVDATIMGAGMGPNGGLETYTENRSTVHLHGGATPWISDGTPHQWITPQGELTNYFKGASFQNVPDMVSGGAVPCRGGATCFTPFPNDGTGTYYYTNEQSARLMFYHDHAYGITRLNVYDGIAAGYLLYDQYEQDMIEGTNVMGLNPTNAKLLPNLGGVYEFGIPLVIQDKTFVNDATTPSAAADAAFPAVGYTKTAKTLVSDPLWAYYTPPFDGITTHGGNLWMGHEYLPVENPADPTGNTWNGRWDYAPFMIPPMIPLNLTLPSPTTIPEAFNDTAMVNGTAFPYVTLPPDAIRFRILNACNDRSVNLQLYYAKDRVTGNVCKAGFPGNTGAGFTQPNCTEVSMIPAAPNASFPTWPRDGRDGGVPDPLTAANPWIQIGNEGGFLAKVAVRPQQPIDFNYNRQVIPMVGVTSNSILLVPAVRADVIADFSNFTNGDVAILYNDGPAAMPNFWPMNDYYTDDPDLTGIGAAPSTPPGFGPNTRTIMQIRISGSKSSSFDFSAPSGASLVALQAALPKVFAASQPPIIVPQLAYNLAYPSGPHHYTGTTDNYVQGYQTTVNISGAPTTIAKIMTVAPGNNYPTPPTVLFSGGSGTGAAATAGLNPIGLVTLLTTGTGYTSAPTIALGAPDPLVAPAVTRVQAIAVATVSGGGVNAIDITEPGANYTNILTPPSCTITGGGGTGATCSVQLPTLNTVGSIVITNAGSGYTKQPQLILVPTTPGGLGASAVARLTGDLAMTGKNMTEGFDPEYGRMFIELGSTPNPLTPSVGAGFVIGISRYIDPPTEIMNDDEVILWRLAHLGVDSHAMHFHLFNLQVVNHVDWTNVIKAPYDEEIGWKETIRTNPMEDIIMAIQPKSSILPFPIPNSNRVLDPTTPLNSTTNFYPVPPPPGIPAVAQQSNVMTNFGWEYVWHCHLLGHEENDMMRPMVLVVAGVVPLAPGLTLANVVATPGQIALTWTINGATTPNNAPSGFIVNRCSGSTTCTNFAPVATIYDKTVLTYADTSVTSGTIYRYEIVAFNANGNSPASTIRNRTASTFTAPTVAITAPLGGATFTEPATIPITATATPHGAGVTISKVEFYNGSSLIATVNTPGPYTFNFTGVNAGTLTLTAKAYESNGATAVSAAVIVTVTAALRNDFNKDGFVDILWRNTTTGDDAVWFMNGTTHTSTVFLEPMADTTWAIVGTGDFSKTGNTDILWRNTTSGNNAVWSMNGTTHTSTATLEPLADTTWAIVSTGDFDKDGNVDILWRNTVSGANAVWLMNGTTHTSTVFLESIADTNWKIVSK